MEKFDINKIETTLIKTDKFKTITFLVVFFGEFNQENATKRSLLTGLMNSTTKNYSTKNAFVNKLFDLYDASAFVSSYPIYKTNLTMFGLSIVNPKFVEDNNLLKESFDFFKEVIFNPNIDVNGFNLNEFNENKRKLRDNINNIYNNKTAYAYNRLLEEMGPEEIISVSSLGTIDNLDKITPKSLKVFYDEVINNEMVKIFVTGDISKEDVIECFNGFSFNNVVSNIDTSSREMKKNIQPREVVEKQNVNQSQLMMGFRTNTNAIDDLYIPMAIFNMMYGGMVSSDLFRVVREENSLAYSVGSSIFFDSRIMIVNAGIDRNNYELTKDLVIKELERYQNGNINQELMQVAKDNLISSMLEISDSPFSNLNFLIKNSLLKQYTINDIIKLINEVTSEQVIEASKLIALDIVYCLEGVNDGDK